MFWFQCHGIEYAEKMALCFPWEAQVRSQFREIMEILIHLNSSEICLAWQWIDAIENVQPYCTEQWRVNNIDSDRMSVDTHYPACRVLMRLKQTITTDFPGKQSWVGLGSRDWSLTVGQYQRKRVMLIVLTYIVKMYRYQLLSLYKIWLNITVASHERHCVSNQRQQAC